MRNSSSAPDLKNQQEQNVTWLIHILGKACGGDALFKVPAKAALTTPKACARTERERPLLLSQHVLTMQGQAKNSSYTREEGSGAATNQAELYSFVSFMNLQALTDAASHLPRTSGLGLT